MELLIVIALIALIAAGLMVLINPMQQFAKSHDAKRKLELDTLRKAFEDYYNDRGCYPKPEEVCYDQPQNVCDTLKTTTSRVCHICGLESTPTEFSKFSPYLNSLPCDPQHPSKDYLYQVEIKCDRDPDVCAESVLNCSVCPKWYKIFTDFSTKNDKDSANTGCYEGGCGLIKPPPLYSTLGYDYGITSGNISLLSSGAVWACHYKTSCGGGCHTCGDSNGDGTSNTYQDCLVPDNVCCDQSKIYPSMDQCTSANPQLR